MTSGDVRAGDQEREDVARLLRDHCVEGRLSFDELDHRLHRVYLARTRLELEQLILDLPSGSDGSRAEERGRRIFWPGVAAFHEERHLDGPCEASYAAALKEIVPRMGIQGFRLVEELAPRRLRFVDASGLDVTVMFRPAIDGGTDVSAFGQAPRAIRKAFATLRD